MVSVKNVILSMAAVLAFCLPMGAQAGSQALLITCKPLEGETRCRYGEFEGQKLPVALFAADKDRPPARFGLLLFVDMRADVNIERAWVDESGTRRWSGYTDDGLMVDIWLDGAGYHVRLHDYERLYGVEPVGNGVYRVSDFVVYQYVP